MIMAFVKVGDKIHKCKISKETHEILRDVARIRNKTLSWFLAQVVLRRGKLTEENILGWLKEHRTP